MTFSSSTRARRRTTPTQKAAAFPSGQMPLHQQNAGSVVWKGSKRERERESVAYGCESELKMSAFLVVGSKKLRPSLALVQPKPFQGTSAYCLSTSTHLSLPTCGGCYRAMLCSLPSFSSTSNPVIHEFVRIHRHTRAATFDEGHTLVSFIHDGGEKAGMQV